MKISNKQFARALYESVKDKKKSEVKTILQNFVVLLHREGAMSRAEQIMKEFVGLFNKEEGIVSAQVKSLNKLDKKSRTQVEKFVQELTKSKTVELSEEEDKTVLGGLVIKYGDKILDGSLRTRVGRLRAELKK
jgi:F-type H+-transporting ATPase subunit delta